MAAVPPPVPRDLLPPLLACLPTAFVSPRPPPALLPLLSPILRQRVQYSSSSSGKDGWLALLTWNSDRASRLTSKIEGLELEPHPVSGELEIEEVESLQYRRLDEETLQVQLRLEEFGLAPVYVWCETDTQGGGSGPGWKLSELRALEDSNDPPSWHTSISEANASANISSKPLPQLQTHTDALKRPAADTDDDDYWASYDRDPSGTPAKDSPVPTSQPFSRTQPAPPRPSAGADDDYYSRYSTVQPALDSHDPDEEEAAAASNSTLQGNALNATTTTSSSSAQPPAPQPQPRSLYPADPPRQLVPHPIAPRPLSPASTTSGKSVEHLERRARTEADLARAEHGVRTFIGSEVRGLFRLAQSVGMDRDEFDECIRRELDLVGMLEDS